MSACARGCCWTGMQICARAYECACHWGDWLHAERVAGGADRTYRDPTSREAIANVMKEREK